MKFGKRLKQQIQESLPEWRDKYLSYKELKKLVRLISTAPTLSNGSLEYGKTEAEFVYFLNNEVDKFNGFFMEKEEDFIIRHMEVQQRIKRVVELWGPNGSQASQSDFKEEMAKIRKAIVDFHGEMVLLVNYSNINYTGLAKILKKYDKRTGGLLRLPFIQKVLEQPFFTTDLISKLVKECESIIDAVFPAEEEAERAKEANEAITVAGEGIFRNTVAALLTMQEIRNGSSTQSPFSLPPLNLPDSDLIQSIQLNAANRNQKKLQPICFSRASQKQADEWLNGSVLQEEVKFWTNPNIERLPQFGEVDRLYIGSRNNERINVVHEVAKLLKLIHDMTRKSKTWPIPALFQHQLHAIPTVAPTAKAFPTLNDML
ncbi:hypothetical protein VNO78_25494 [Psophocarpus tetragonolobus]|uniref:SPX domain-containing protein n=1 Tax=Psophocarpus tetragonolobus TaxID=3891 RepID=A0AAN9XFE0_PSOTE